MNHTLPVYIDTLDAKPSRRYFVRGRRIWRLVSAFHSSRRNARVARRTKALQRELLRGVLRQALAGKRVRFSLHYTAKGELRARVLS